MSFLHSFLAEARDSSSRRVPEGAFDAGDPARAPEGLLDREDSRFKFKFGLRAPLPRGVAGGELLREPPRATRVERRRVG
jgi:hypothetical protein